MYTFRCTGKQETYACSLRFLIILKLVKIGNRLSYDANTRSVKLSRKCEYELGSSLFNELYQSVP